MANSLKNKTNISLQEALASFQDEAAARRGPCAGRFVIVDMNDHAIYGAESLDPRKTGLAPDTAADYFLTHASGWANERNKNESAVVHDKTANVNIIFFNEILAPPEKDNLCAATLMHLYFTLDQELGHCAIKDGFPTSTNPWVPYGISEFVADSYAMIRHFQRFGTDRGYKEIHVDPAARTKSLVENGDLAHFTTFALKAILRNKNRVDFSRLTPAETAARAHAYAAAFMPSQEEAVAFYTSFQQAGAVAKKSATPVPAKKAYAPGRTAS